MTLVYIITGAVLLILLYCFSETLRFKKVTYNVEDRRIPTGLSGRKVILLSDLHCVSFGKDNKRLLNAISGTGPDFIIIAGDLCNGHKASEFDYAENFLKQLKQTVSCPIYYTYGNHELKFEKYLKEESKLYTDLVLKYCTLINNDSLQLCEGCRIYGLVVDSEFYHGNIEEMSNRFTVRSKLGKPDSADCFNILIAHDPSFYRKYLKWGADLVLSGHLHGGIFRLPPVGGIVSPRYRFFPKPDKGMFEYDDGKIIISGGLGWHGIPFRFCNLPEIVEINFNGNAEVKHESSGKTRSI